MTRKHLLLAAAGILLAGPALAGGISLHATVLKAETITAWGGGASEKLVSADKAVPGDAMVYLLSVHNDGAAPASDIVLSNPIPATMVYRGAGKGGEPDVSVDGTHFGRLADLTVAASDGSRRPARLADVTSVRWHLSSAIPAGGTDEVSFHAILR